MSHHCRDYRQSYMPSHILSVVNYNSKSEQKLTRRQERKAAKDMKKALKSEKDFHNPPPIKKRKMEDDKGDDLANSIIMSSKSKWNQKRQDLRRKKKLAKLNEFQTERGFNNRKSEGKTRTKSKSDYVKIKPNRTQPKYKMNKFGFRVRDDFY